MIETRIKFSWCLNYSCNYRCPYCWFYGQWQELIEKEKYFSPEEWLKMWENIYKRYGSVDIELTGGEPFIYPNFGRLIKLISQLHNIIITTNLSINIEKVINENKIDSHRVKISPTFHPNFVKFEDFIKKALFLKRSGFGSMVNYLAYPSQIRPIDYYKNKFEQEGLSFQIMTFWGKYKDKDYPAGYTEEEKNIINPSLGRRYPTDEKFQLSPKQTKGSLCMAGHKYAVVLPNGEVMRCGGSENGRIFGNFFDQEFKLLDGPSPCNSNTCKCNEYAFLLLDEDEQVEELNENIASSRSLVPPYKVFFTWDLNRECNYRCSYCAQVKMNDPVYPYPGIERLLEIWNDIYKRYGTCHIHISGGEPFVYPYFMELIEQLTKIHTLEFSTNLYWDIERFIKNISPDRAQLGVSYHPEFADFEIFFKKTKLLKENGFNVWVNYVAYPPQLETLPIYKEKVETEGIKFSILPFNGEYEGRKYPDNYTTEEKKKLKFYTETDEVNERMFNWRTDKNISDTKGKLCRMGQMYARIYPDGNVQACCGQNATMLGNFYQGIFNLLNEPIFCKLDNCPCWKSMLVGKEEEWEKHWRFPIV